MVGEKKMCFYQQGEQPGGTLSLALGNGECFSEDRVDYTDTPVICHLEYGAILASWCQGFPGGLNFSFNGVETQRTFQTMNSITEHSKF